MRSRAKTAARMAIAKIDDVHRACRSGPKPLGAGSVDPELPDIGHVLAAVAVLLPLGIDPAGAPVQSSARDSSPVQSDGLW